MKMRDILEARVQVWSGATINVVRNPSRAVFQKMVEKVGVLRGLLSPDGRTVYLWDAYMAVHPNIIQELGLGDYDCIMYARDHWNGPVHDRQGYYPAIERLTPYRTRESTAAERKRDDALLDAIFSDPDFAKLMTDYDEQQANRQP